MAVSTVRACSSRGSCRRDPGRETYRVRPGGATVVALEPDDRLTVVDRDGGQRAELTRRRRRTARRTPTRLGIRAGAPGDRAARARRVLGRRCRARGRRRPRGSRARPVRGDGRGALRRGHRPAPRSRSARRGRGRVVIAAPGRRLGRRRRRAGVATCCSRSAGRAPRTHDELELPPPLAEPRLDFEVAAPPALALRGEGGRVHPGDRRRGPAVLGLPRVPPAQAAGRRRARARRDRDPHADGQRAIRRPGSTASSTTRT